MASTKRTACVVGGAGYVGSLLVKALLERGYAVNATVRDPENEKKVAPLIGLNHLGDLKIFAADLGDEESFMAPIAGCELVFHVATPINFASQDPENDMIKPAVQGVENVIKASAKAKTVKRVIYTSSAASVAINKLQGTGLVLDENNWTDIDFLTSVKPPNWGYSASKALAEKAAWECARANNMDLVTVIPVIMIGPGIVSDVPSSGHLAMCLITGNEQMMNKVLKGMEKLSGSIAITHAEDAVRAHIFVAEKESASGRYIVSTYNTSVSGLAKFLSERYPQYNIPTDFSDSPPQPKVILSPRKIINEGFTFKYSIQETYDQTVEYFKAKGILN